jgi:hypothetical protein
MRAKEQVVRTLTLIALTLLLAATVSVAQDVPPPDKKVDNVELLKRYLDARNRRAKADLRRQLLALSVEELQAAIAAWEFPAIDKPGMHKWSTMCPDGFERPYWVLLPKDYDPAKSYPLLVCLHGGVGGWPLDATEERPAAGHMATQYWSENLVDEWPSNLVIMGCSAGVPETNHDAVWWHLKGQLNVLHMIAETKRRVNIDDERVIVNGHSDGGSGSFGLAFRMPDAFAGFYSMNGHPMVPAADSTLVWLENLKGLNLQAFNGGRDALYPSARVIPIYEQANALGANIKFTNYPQLDHGVADVLEKEVAAFLRGPMADWRRDLLPAAIDWTCSDTRRGRRAWLAIDDIGDMDDLNAVPANAEIKVPAERVRLGIQIRRDVDAPTVEIVVKGSVAESIGMQAGDVVKKLDTHEIAKMQDLLDALDTKAAGDDVVIVVARDGKDVELKGKFPGTGSSRPAIPTARVIATLDAPGTVSVSVRDARKVTIFVAPSMLDKDGRLRVRLNPGKDSKGLGIVAVRKAEPDKGFILDQFEQTGDRKLPWITKFTFDVVNLLGVKAKPANPDQQEDEF